MESAHLFESICCDSSGDGENRCSDDLGCAWESNFRAETAGSVQLKTPLPACDCLLHALAPQVLPADATASLSWPVMPPAWIEHWHLEQRAAWPARAPAQR